MLPSQYEGVDTGAKAIAKANASKALKAFQYLRGQLAYAMGFSHRGQRDLYMQFGYPRLLQLDNFIAMYERNDIATRIIRAFPQATWRDMPTIRDSQGSSPDAGDDYSAFVDAVDDLFEKHQVFSMLEKADRLSSLGQYGLLLMGFRDGLALDQPLQGKAELIYLQAYMQRNITVQKFDTDPKSPRFGKPDFYTVQTGTYGIQQSTTVRSFRVHHTRVIHIAEFLDQDDTFGMPRLEPVYNRLMDLEKVVGGSAEMYWLNASRGVALTADAEASISDESLKDMKAQLEEFDNQLRRNLALQGVTATQLQAAIEDPSPVVGNLLDLIAGSIGMPKRILLGSEMGQLASGQDENNWADRTNERRRTFATPRMLKPFLRIMIDTGNLPNPVDQFWVDWPDSAASPERQANLGSIRSNILRNYCSTPGAELVVPVAEMRKDFMGLPPKSEYEASEVDEALEETMTPPSPFGMPPAEGAEGPPDQADGEGKSSPGEKPLDEKDDEVKTQFKKSKKNARPKPLYVYRPVQNAGDIIEWYKKQGVKTTLDADSMHVTLMWSKTPVDWMKAGEGYGWGSEDDRKKGILRIAPGGPRDSDLFGSDLPKDKCLVLLFNSIELTWRHQSLLGLGCTYEYSTFQPHITITWEPGGIDLDDIKPWTGEIVLGPEQFEEIDTKWKDTIVENIKGEKWRTIRPQARVRKGGIALNKRWTTLRVKARGAAKITKGKANYSPDQDRDDDGRFGEGSGGSTKLRKEGDPNSVNVKAHAQMAKEALGRNLTPEEKDEFRAYSYDSHDDINDALRNPGSKISARLNAMHTTMAKAMANASTPEDLTTYRTLSDDRIAAMIDGDTYLDKGWVSTSTRSDISSAVAGGTSNGHSTVEIHIPKGSRALPIANISSFPKEGEVLIYPSSTYKVSKSGSKTILTLQTTGSSNRSPRQN